MINRKHYQAIMLLIAGLAVTGCAPDASDAPLPHTEDDAVLAKPAPDPAKVAAELRALAGAQVRVVWVQDLGEGTDTGLESDNLRLMGFDSDDELGERAIMATPSNYGRPLITPHGDRVIFSDRHAGTIHIVHWDGTGARPLRDGLALTTWADAAGREWVYFGEEPEMQRLVPKVYRCLIDNPATVELVWERTKVGLNNFQISGDGRRGGGVFPWPHCGVADFNTGQLRVFGRGCYPSLAPDDSGFFWIFDGAHRNLLFACTDTGERWQVPINDAPGIGGYEVYYPRWSNLARFMVMTGPFKEGTGGNRIRGGGTGVEVYVGRFAADFRGVEAWSRITYNRLADFYPDVWVDPVAEAGLEPKLPKPERELQAAEPESRLPWPADRDGLLFLWENRSTPNEIAASASPGGILTCNLEPVGRARYGRNFNMSIRNGAFMADEPAARHATAGIRKAQAFTLELTLTPDDAGMRPASAICTIGGNAQHWSVLLGERDARIGCLLRRADGAPGMEFDLGSLPAGVSSHFVLTYSDNELTAWIDGREIFATAEIFKDTGGDIDLTAGDESMLVFGALPGGGFEWTGKIEGVAIYNRAMTGAEVLRNYEAYAQRLAGRPAPQIVVLDAELVETTAIPAPEDILPYRRALAVNRYTAPRRIAGPVPETDFLVADWVIMDGEVIEAAARLPGRVYRLRLEPYDDRPELEGERLVMDGDAWDLPMYIIIP